MSSQLTKRRTRNSLAGLRQALEFVAPAMHRPMTTGVHEAMTRIFAGTPSTSGSRSTRRGSREAIGGR
jgi:hypothetical protein